MTHFALKLANTVYAMLCSRSRHVPFSLCQYELWELPSFKRCSTDPFVHEFREEGHVRRGVELSDEMLRWADAVLIVTDHKQLDYQRVVDLATLVVDTRNATAGLREGRALVIPLSADGTKKAPVPA